MRSQCPVTDAGIQTCSRYSLVCVHCKPRSIPGLTSRAAAPSPTGSTRTSPSTRSSLTSSCTVRCPHAGILLPSSLKHSVFQAAAPRGRQDAREGTGTQRPPAPTKLAADHTENRGQAHRDRSPRGAQITLPSHSNRNPCSHHLHTGPCHTTAPTLLLRMLKHPQIKHEPPLLPLYLSAAQAPVSALGWEGRAHPCLQL